MANTKIADYFKDADEFCDTLNDAEPKAAGSREVDFIDGLRERYDQYLADMYLSEAQADWLKRIAGR